MSLQHAYNNFKQAVASGELSYRDYRRCACKGSGWILSYFDTFHECPLHRGRYHPESRTERAEEYYKSCLWREVGDGLWILTAYYHGGDRSMNLQLTWVEYRVQDDDSVKLRSGRNPSNPQHFESAQKARDVIAWHHKEAHG